MASSFPQTYAPANNSAGPPYPTSDGPLVARYVPDNYSTLPHHRKSEINDPPTQSLQQRSQPQERVTFEPPRPEQYRPSQDMRGVPPAQLPPDYQDPRFTDVENYDHDHDRRPHNRQRHGSADSRHSGRSHGSAHHHHDRHRDSYDERDRSSHHHHRHERRSHSSNRDPAEDHKLKRKDTPRGYGSSLFALFDGIKRYAKGV